MLRFAILAAILFLIPLWVVSPTQATPSFHVTRIDLTGPISPAQDELMQDALRAAEDSNSDLFLLVLDTPGGLGESMRSMVQTILNSHIPVAVWVGPAGSRAASAGVFIVAASTVAGMAPQTTIGAASPVGLGGEEISKTMARKVRNDFTSLVRTVAESKGRNADWYGKSVSDSVSISATEARKINVIEIVADSPATFLSEAGEKGIDFQGEIIRFSKADISIQQYRPGLRYEILSWLLHPQIAYLLIMGGMLGLFIEFTHPGTILPGVLGALCLLLGLYATSVLPTNIAGLLLILFSLVLFVLELQVTSFGMLAVAGAASMFVGSIILFRDEYGSIQIPLSFIIWPVALVVVSMGAILFLVIRSSRRKTALGTEGMVGLEGRVLNWDNGRGQIAVRGEIWAAKGVTSDFTPARGSCVEIVAISGLMLKIGPCAR